MEGHSPLFNVMLPAKKSLCFASPVLIALLLPLWITPLSLSLNYFPMLQCYEQETHKTHKQQPAVLINDIHKLQQSTQAKFLLIRCAEG